MTLYNDTMAAPRAPASSLTLAARKIERIVNALLERTLKRALMRRISSQRIIISLKFKLFVREMLHGGADMAGDMPFLIITLTL